MGKFGPRLATRKKAKRWRKGQSASSNPESTKHRDQVRSAFFQPISGGGSLTVDALTKHNAFQGKQPKIKDHDSKQMDDDSMDASTCETFDTFATSYTNCTNISFSRFLDHFQSNSAIHKEMLAVLAAITEVIKQNGGTESSTEYYAALMTALEAAETQDSVTAIISLLGMGMKTVPKNVLKQQFGRASQVFLEIMTKHASEENFLILRHCISCLSILLRVQEGAVWAESSTIHVLNAILSFTIHSKPKLRKSAQHAICSILKGSDIMKSDDPPTHHPAALHVAKHFLAQLESSGKPGHVTSTLHVLSLLKDIIHQFPKNSVKSLCEGLLSIMTLNNVLVTSCCLQTLHGLFVSKPTETTLPPQLNAQIINALFDYQPASGDVQPTLAWLAVMQEAYCNLALHDPELCAANIPRIIENCMNLWLSDKTEVISGASNTLKTLLETCIATLCEKKELAERCKPTLVKSIQLIQGGLSNQYHSAWHHVLFLLASLIKIIGPICEAELMEILVKLRDLRDSYKFSYNSEIDYAVGAAVKSLGPERVLIAIPLQAPTGEVDLKRSWILPVLKDCTCSARLGYFINNLLPLAESCWQKFKLLKEKNDRIAAHSNELLCSQIWALLPSFCNNPPDIKTNFARIAKILGTAISERKDLRLSILSSLRKLIQKSVDNANVNDVNELAKFAKNYLPLLFNIYTYKPTGTDEEGQRLACFETIKIYLKITPAELIGELFDKAVENLSLSDATEFFKESIFDLVRVLCQYTDISRVHALYNKCVPLLESKEQKEQKKAYRFLEDICGSKSSVCQQFVVDNRKLIQKAIIKATSALHKPSKGARIRCITYLVEKHPQLEKTKFLKAIVPEAVTCLNELNERCRTSSYALLNTIAEKFLNNEEHFKEFIDMLINGLNESSTHCSTSLLALTSITHHYNGALGVETVQKILQFTCDILKRSNRETTLSGLSFIKVYLSAIPTPLIAPMLVNIVKALTSMTEDCKRHWRQKVRDILIKLVRKFGVDVIADMVPPSDLVMHKRLKNIRKIETRKQTLKEQKMNGQNDDESLEEFNVKRKQKSLEEILADSDEELCDTDDEKSVKTHKKKREKKTWIQESTDNIVDFADPATAKNITTMKPNISSGFNTTTKSKSSSFKTASDGRLIIADDSNDSSEDEGKKKKKNKLPFDPSDGQDSASDHDDNDSKTILSMKKVEKKRKLSGSTASVISTARSTATSKYQAGGSGIHRPLKKVKKVLEPGEEYRSKKGFGDVKRKGKPDPYAYIPLKRSALNRRNKAKVKKSFKNILSHNKEYKKLKSNSKYQMK
ncbi:RRP12-like protein [Copidosoma floridanum]|uniref:RRP12-like protein n=1 Tax=Copidosoma floridanum TaxID=29053 RepID=UPI0006C9888A|nr:RRP12-like protein [Copidosoma floridanum]